MACRGVLFAITEEDVKHLLAARLAAEPNEAVLEVLEEIEERWEEDWLMETDKSWDAMHRCLTDGKLEFDNGNYPLNHCILGGTQLYDGDDYIISLKTPNQVADIAAALKPIGEADLRQRHDKIDRETYQGTVDEANFEYTWSWFPSLPEFYANAAEAGRSVIFTVDQ